MISGLPSASPSQAHAFTAREMMAIAAAREIQNGDIVFCGTGISLLAAMAAKNIGAPDAVIFLKAGPSTPGCPNYRLPSAIRASCTAVR